ncbi:MAG TPA: efflux RND transporter periplasmic adaptor subunit [Burkholderiales bacterium]|nr:efflux RND transporter periplasmic adaptor subunit [Burkholderiales bacterium]
MRKNFLLLPALLPFVLAACTKGDARQEASAPPAVSVTVLKAEAKPVPIDFEAVGRTEGSREVQVRARVSGILEQQFYTEGDTVKAGAPLFRIERAPYEIELAQARAALAQERAKRELAGQEVDRLKRLADRRAISQREADQAISGAKQSDASVDMAEARVRQAELNLSWTAVDAPIAGISGRTLQSVGTLVTPGQDSSLLTTITRADPLWVRFALSEPEFAALRSTEARAPQVKLELADGKPYPVAGRINFSGSTVDASLGTVQMRAEFPNAKLALLPGQYVKVHVISGTREAIVVPQTAVAQNEGGRFVWLMGADGKAQQRPVKLGQWLGNGWVVDEGLKSGDSVIVDNLIRLRPGTAVQAKAQG